METQASREMGPRRPAAWHGSPREEERKGAEPVSEVRLGASQNCEQVENLSKSQAGEPPLCSSAET